MQKFPLSLTSLEIWVVGLCAAASFISQQFLPLAVGSAVAFGLMRWVARGRFSLRTPADWPIALLVLLLPVTLWVTNTPDITITQVLRLLTGISLFYAVINWTTSASRIRWLVRGIWLAGLLLALFAFVSVQWNSTKLNFIPPAIYTHFRILVADTANPNVMAGNLAIILPCAMGVLLFCGRRLRFFELGLSGLAISVVTIVLVLTQSRGGMLAFGEIIILLAVLRWKRGWLLLAGAAILVGVVVIQLGPLSILNVIFSNTTFGGIDGRLEVWSRAIYIIQDFPLTGVGMGSYGRVADVFYPFFLHASNPPPHAHNLFLQIAVDLGIPGLVAWLAIWMLVTLAAWKLYWHGLAVHDNWASGLGAGLLCSQLALVSCGMLDAVTWGMVKPAPLVWVMWGLALAGWYVYGRQT